MLGERIKILYAILWSGRSDWDEDDEFGDVVVVVFICWVVCMLMYVTINKDAL